MSHVVYTYLGTCVVYTSVATDLGWSGLHRLGPSGNHKGIP